jgi:hypothetical protein
LNNEESKDSGVSLRFLLASSLSDRSTSSFVGASVSMRSLSIEKDGVIVGASVVEQMGSPLSIISGG